MVREETTLQSLLQQALTRFEAQEFAGAVESFGRLETVFGREPEYRAAATQQVVLPLHGYAELVAGDAADAVALFERFLEAFPGPSRKEAFVLFSLGQAHQELEQWAASRAAYERFVAGYADLPEAGVARLRIGESFVAEGRIDEALAALDAFYDSRFAFSLRLQARLRALQLSLETTRWDAAATYLLETPWDVQTMPELALLAFAALEIGDYLMAEERFDEAVRAYRLVPGYAELKRRQAERLALTEATFAHRASFAAGGDTAVWSDYYRELIARLRALQEQLEAGEDYTGSHLLRYGQAFAAAGRHLEAWTVFAAAAEAPELRPAEREEAHYRWEIEAQALKRWPEALAIAQQFVERYPDSPQAPIVLFLLANAHQQTRAYRQAVAILDQLLRDYPDHRMRDRWLFTRGFNHVLLEDYGRAREDLTAYTTRFPRGSLVLEAQLWTALAWFFEKRYEPALEALDSLLAITPGDHYLRPEMAYRRGAVLYAMRDYAGTLAQLDAYLQSFPEDRNGPEAQVLRGDTLMGLGRLEEAAATFAQIGPQAGRLFPYAVFQVGKIHRALEDYGAMAEHFRGYVERTDLDPHPRRAEALHWLGWALEQQGRLEEAVPVYLGALERFADDPGEPEVDEILGSLHRLHDRLRSSLDPAAIDRDDVFLATARFMDWLGVAEESALNEGRPTAYSRFRLYEADRRRAAGQGGEAAAMLCQLGDELEPARLDDKGLAAVGLAWQDAGKPGAEAFFEDLLRRFPYSPERVAAWYGLGRAALAAGDPVAAVAWLEPVRDWLTHPVAPEAILLYGEALLALGRPAEVAPAMEDLLRLRSARGRPHARALLLMARAADAAGDPDRAIPLFQRVYNLYRAYPELIVPAYVRSAELFEDRGDLRAARDTWREMLAFEVVADPDLRARAEQAYERLDALVPPDPVVSAETAAEASAPDPEENPS